LLKYLLRFSSTWKEDNYTLNSLEQPIVSPTCVAVKVKSAVISLFARSLFILHSPSNPFSESQDVKKSIGQTLLPDFSTRAAFQLSPGAPFLSSRLVAFSYGFHLASGYFK
jgi:hypothetical protein